MTLEEKIKLIEEKIANLPQEFNVEERHIINSNPRLKELFVQTILNNTNLITEEVINYLPDEIVNALIEENSNKVYFYFIENMLQIAFISTNDLINYLNQTDLTQEQREYFKDKIKQAFLNKELSIDKFAQNQETILEMLEYGRFDLISQSQCDYIDDECLEKVWNAYPFEQYPFPKFFANSSSFVSKHIQDFPLEEAVKAYFKLLRQFKRSFNQEEKASDSKLLSTYIPIFQEKLSQVETLNIPNLDDLLMEPNDLVLDSYFYKEYGESFIEGINNIAVKLFRLGLYEIALKVYDEKLIPKEEAREAIIKLATSDQRKEIERMNLEWSSMEFSTDKELVTILIENGFLREALNMDNKLFEEKLPYIIEQLNNKNEKFKHFSNTLEYVGKNKSVYPFELYDLYVAMLNSGFVDNIVISSSIEFDEQEINFLNQILINYPNVKFNAQGLENNNFLEILVTLIQTNRIDSIVDYLKYTRFKDNKELFIAVNKYNILTNIINNDFSKGLDLLECNAETIISIPELLDEYYKNDVYINRILDFVNHHENLESFYNVENYNKIKKYLSKTYKIPLETLDFLQDNLGPLIIRYVENENIQSLAKLSKEELYKIMSLLKKDTYTMQDLRGTYDSLKQYEFSKKHSDIVQIFPTLLHAIEDKNQELIDELTAKIAKELDSNFLKRFLKKYDLPKEFTQDNIIELVQLVVSKVKTSQGEKLEKYHMILHEMTDYYISKKREEYRNTYNMEEELNIPYEFDKKSLENTLLRYIIMNSKSIKTRIRVPQEQITIENKDGFFRDWLNNSIRYYSLYDHLISRLEAKGIDKQLATETIEYYITKDKSVCTDLPLVQKTIAQLIKVTREMTDEIPDLESINQYGITTMLIDSYIKQADANNEIKRIYKLDDKNSLFNLLTQLNIPALQRGVLSNPEVYESLLNTMEKRKLHLLPQCISNILGTSYINISPDLSNIAGFISYYEAIYDNVKSNLEANGKSSDDILLNITNILIYAEVYSGISSVYSQILGSEDAKLIKANPGPNAASRKLANDGRLKEAVERTKKLYTRQEVTIPPFEEDFSLSSNKKMRAVVGNFTHPSNLTHGERTGACMRIGGVGESLFEFALDNPNGFHIRFEDPETHEYISRVTGFRNGNTVFLNELRDSCNKDKYNNEDVIETCRKAAEMLIELSKNSPCPIENVVVHKAYATINMEEPMVNLGIDNIKEGLPQFYTDVSASAIVLATSAKDRKFAPVNLDKSQVPTYQPLREKPQISRTIQEASGKINRVNSVKRLLAGENYEYIEPYKFSNGLIYAIVSNDWYLYVDESGNINKELIDIDPRAKEELAQALIEVEQNLAQIKSESQEAKYGL
jgi:hypothetical protein